MNVIGIILGIVIAILCGWQLFGLIRDIKERNKQRREKQNKTESHINEKSDNKE